MDAINTICRIHDLAQMSNSPQTKVYKERINPFSIPDDQFKLKYRIKKSTVKMLANLVKEKVTLESRGCGTSVELQVLVALRCWGRGEFQDYAGDLHGQTQPTVSRICGRVARALACHGGDKIKMPTTLEEKALLIRYFKTIRNFPGVIGAIDGTHIRIKKTGGDLAQYYTNRKEYYSLTAVCIKTLTAVVSTIS